MLRQTCSVLLRRRTSALRAFATKPDLTLVEDRDGIRTITMNNPAKYNGLSGYGLEVTGRVPLFAPITLENKRYIDTKRMKMGHLFEMMPHVSEQGEPSR